MSFDANLKVALNINVQGTKRLIDLCKTLKHLEALVHVSTAYSNCNRIEIGEIIYPVPWDVEKIIQTTYSMNTEQIDKHTSKIIGEWPNTYTFTKALAEQVVAEASEDLPITIIRPSIIISTARDPFSGWIESWNGHTGIVSIAAKGVWSSFFIRHEAIVDMVPVDVVVNLLICSAWALACKKTKNLTIYNCCSSNQKPLKWGEFISLCLLYSRKHPMEKIFWYPEAYCCTNRFFYNISFFFSNVFPAYFMDTINVFMKNKIKLVPMQKKISKALQIVEHFTTHEWHFKTENSINLRNLLNKMDNEKFSSNIDNICWPSYLENYMLGIRKHIFSEPDSTIPKARQMLKRYKLAHHMIRFALVIFIFVVIGLSARKFATWWQT